MTETMSAAELSLGALVFTPLIAAALAALVPVAYRRVLTLIAAVAIAVATGVVLIAVAGGEVVTLALGGYEPPLGITLRADGMGVAFVVLTTIVGSAVSVFAAAMRESTGVHLGYDDSGKLSSLPGNAAFWPLWLGCWTGLNAVFVSGDFFNTYVGLEVVGLTSVALVALGGGESFKAALRYLYVAVIGSMLFLVAIGLLVSVTGTLDILQATEVLAASSEDDGLIVIAAVLTSVGLCLKLALVPFQGWLIPAHAGAPSAVSPLLSALVIKASLFVFLRFWLWPVGTGLESLLGGSVPDDDPMAAAASTAIRGLMYVLAALGAAAILYGSVMALRQQRLKPLVAYSTVAQVGYWFLFLPMLATPTPERAETIGVTTLTEGGILASAVTGTVCLSLGHGLAKACLFLAAGYLKDLYGTDDLVKLRGVGKNQQFLLLAMGMAAVGLAGLPLSLSFSGKWMLASAALAGSHYFIIVVIVVATLLSAAYMLRVLAPILMKVSDRSDRLEGLESQLSTTSRTPALAAMALGTASVLAGFLGAAVAGLMDVGAVW